MGGKSHIPHQQKPYLRPLSLDIESAMQGNEPRVATAFSNGIQISNIYHHLSDL
jgi:hypothetical protein